MSFRVPKHVSTDLIRLLKKIEVKACVYDQQAKSAVEFYRQMDSPKLKKLNPAYSVEFAFLDTVDQVPTAKAEFINGHIWNAETRGKTCAQLRFELFELADALDEEDLDESDVPESKPQPSKGGKKK